MRTWILVLGILLAGCTADTREGGAYCEERTSPTGEVSYRLLCPEGERPTCGDRSPVDCSGGFPMDPPREVSPYCRGDAPTCDTGEPVRCVVAEWTCD